MRLRRPILGFSLLAFAALVFAPGEARSTVEEQRARLPPAADCSDPVEGHWMALIYAENRSEWYEYSLDIQRKAPGSDLLEGTLASHFWHGGKDDSKPPPCSLAFGYEANVSMPDGTGSIDKDLTVIFGATKWKLDKLVCGHTTIRYNPDHFSGTIDPQRQEFQSVNNDGGMAVNEPAVFRRISCFDKDRPKNGVNVKPPDFAPKKKGCGK